VTEKIIVIISLLIQNLTLLGLIIEKKKKEKRKKKKKGRFRSVSSMDNYVEGSIHKIKNC
jgi:hypothetical protein